MSYTNISLISFISNTFCKINFTPIKAYFYAFRHQFKPGWLEFPFV